ncbi:MAG: di-trans,poly-cis-decaprenylcistransferase [Rickettsiales bacterium]|jgi:undecaprenyl diphosphate synthase|nr:di-trans,poly-cis-decaprenylcistransferase [Rickettsiales bacterium]
MFFKKRKEAKAPQHVAFICDGNRRWARARGMPATYGHEKGADIVDTAAEYLINHGVSTVSFFVFSIENRGRDKKEIKFLMDFILKEMPKHAKRAGEKNIRVRFVGRRDHLSPEVVKMCERLESDTEENTGGTVAFALDFGGQDEIVRAANAAIAAGAPVDAETFESFMDTGDLLPIDLLVRTSGEQRVSNFMLWKLAYAELLFYPKCWPALRDRDFARMLAEYGIRQRRYGK